MVLLALLVLEIPGQLANKDRPAHKVISALWEIRVLLVNKDHLGQRAQQDILAQQGRKVSLVSKENKDQPGQLV